MAIRKLDVIGIMTVGDVAPGGVVELDDEIINVDALITGGLCQEHVEDDSSSDDLDLKSFKKSKGKGD
jgi:hypothetical protein